MGSEAGAGADALGLIDAVLGGRPDRDEAALGSAVAAICAYRQGMIGRRDAGDWTDTDEHGLATLNGVLSLVLAAQFPLGTMRWHELEGARAALAELVGRAGPG